MSMVKGSLDADQKVAFIRGQGIKMPDRLVISIGGTPDAIVLTVETQSKEGGRVTYFDCPPMRIGEKVRLANLRDALLKFTIV